MRILVVADIHSNWHALAAIREEFDACLCLGDIVDYGSDPVPCVEWVRNHATYCVRGNHDHAVAQRVAIRGARGFRRLAAATRPLQWDLLGSAHLKFLSRLPLTQTAQLDAVNYLLVHATPRDPLDEYLFDDKAAWKNRLLNVQADIVCVGHTHIPCVLDVDGVKILNPGSVGQPRDGDPRAAYAVIDNGRIELKRVAYDINATLDQMRSQPLDPWVSEATELLLRSGGQLPPDDAAE